MSNFFKNRNKLMIAMGAFFLAATILAGSFAYMVRHAVPEDKAVMAETDGGDLEDPNKDDPPEEPEDDGLTSVSYNMPGEMRGVYLTPGVDIITGSDTSESALKAEIKEAVSSAKELGMNTVIIDTSFEDQVIYRTRNAPGLSGDFDVMACVVDTARDHGMYVFGIFDASLYEDKPLAQAMAMNAGSINTLGSNLGEFAEKYGLDGILLDGYANRKTDDSYSLYALMGGGMGFENFMRQSPAAVVRTSSSAIRQSAPSTQVGLLADAVWENSDAHDEGSATAASYTSLSGGNADTKGFVEEGLVDFVAVKAYGSTSDSAMPFDEVVVWWADVAQKSDMPLYVVHAADKLGDGWSADEIIKQAAAVDEISGVRGSVFNTLKPLASDTGGVASSLNKLYKMELAPELILTQLEMTKPEQSTFTTTETTVTFTGASDPTEPVTINDQTIPTDDSGYFTVTMDLKAGENAFAIVHKEKTINYQITRQVEILRDITPTGSITAEGGMSITISAWAYQDATVSAAINGATVSMSIDEEAIDEADRDSTYKLFTGRYTAPAATASEQNLGSIVVSASWNGETKSLEGASVTVNKKAKIEDGVPVMIVADQAKTYPADTLDNIPRSDCYPLPAGAMDYAVGDELVYKKDGKTYSYYVLASGARVESGDISAISDDYASQNVINGMEVNAQNGYTYVTLNTAQKVSYTFSYASGGVKIVFHNTVKTPESTSLGSNPIFSGAKWNGTDTLELTFLKSGGFMGYRGYYDSKGNLVLRFNNPPASISGARIAVDPGHGGSDPGALGFLSDYPEKALNAAIAKKLAAELESRGATVLLLDTAGGMSLADRVARAESFEADILVSIHNNTASNAGAAGTEVYYHYPFSKALASGTSNAVSSGLNTNNRGAKQSYFNMTLSSEMASVLVECGFMSNKNEYEKLISEKYQTNIAVGVADGISSAIKAAATGSSATGSQSTGDTQTPADPETTTNTDTDTDNNTSASAPSSGGIEDLGISRDSTSVAVGKTTTLKASVYPESASASKLVWSSANESVAKVSSSGKVTGVKEGKTKITVATEDGKLTATCELTVTKASNIDDDDDDDWDDWLDTDDPDDSSKADDSKVQGVALGKNDYYEFDSGSINLYVKTTRQLEILNDDDEVVKPTEFTWSTSNSSAATVDAYGVVTAKNSEGTARITAAPKNGGDEVVCTVKVTKTKTAVTGVSLNKSKLTVLKGKTNKELVATLKPSSASVTDLTWSTKNKKIATVDANGYVTGVNKGTTTITATSKDGKHKATVEVTVVKGEDAIDSLDLSDTTLELFVDEEYTLDVEFYPDYASEVAVVWSSSNSKVVKVDQKGNLVALKRGTATIRVESATESGCYDTCKVTVIN